MAKTVAPEPKIQRKYLGDDEAEWEEIDENEFLRRTEWASYFPKGTALAELKKKGKLSTPAAEFRLKK